MNKGWPLNPGVFNVTVGLVLSFCVALLIFSPLFQFLSCLYDPTVHIFLDVLSIVACIMVFIIGWHSYQYNRLPFVLLIAVPFLEVGLLDLIHMFFFLDMLEWDAAGLFRKEAYYWMWARWIESWAILVSLLWPWRRVVHGWFKQALIVVCLLSLVLIFGIDWLWEVSLSPFLAERWMPFQEVAGLGVLPVYLAAAWMVLRDRRLPAILRSHYVMLFLLVSALADVCFVLAHDVNHVLYFLGHLYKVLAYGCLLQDILRHGIRSPYEQLAVSTKVLENISDAVVITDKNQKIVFVNPAFTKITGYTVEETVGRTPRLLQSGIHTAEFYKKMWQSLNDRGIWQGEIWDRKKNGQLFLSAVTITVVKDEQGRMTHFASLFNDVTEERQLQKQMRYLAFHDPLTGVYNRNYLFAKLDEVLQQDENGRQPMAVIFVDLDRFKQINDGLGHEAGDQLLRQVAYRLRNAVSDTDVVARFGGDEFVILRMGVSDPEEVRTLTLRILAEIERPFELNGQEYFIGGSIGVSFYPRDSTERDTLIKYADLAMYKAKENGGGIVFYETDMEVPGSQRMKIETMLRKSIQQPDFQLYYQPQMTPAGDIIGVEVLIRWGPDGEWIPPEMFIAVAEDTGLIKHLDRWVLLSACQQYLEWQPVLNRPLRLAVNISSKQLQQDDFADYVRHVLQVTKIEPSCLELEITENAFIDQPKRAIGLLKNLKKMGVRIAIDDFGAGYSSLGYLRDFPVDTLKIDRSFIKNLENSPATFAIVKAILQVSHDLGIEVVAEGVETPRQKEILDRMRCHVLQGYLFSTPMSANDMLQWLIRKVS